MQTTVKEIGCVKAATQILGDKWSPQILRFINNGTSMRFCRIQDLAEGINPRTLSARLDSLEKNGIIKKNPTTSSRCEYCLTKKGYDLIPILNEMKIWGEKYQTDSNLRSS